MTKVVVIGLDSMAPDLIRVHHRHRMPFLNHLFDTGFFSPMRSCDPPITVPAWATMTCGVTPNRLGLYGFHELHRDGRPGRLWNSTDLRATPFWRLAVEAGKRALVISVPLSSPLMAHRRISQTVGFMAPADTRRFASRPSLATELNTLFGPYQFDVEQYRTASDQLVLAQCKTLTSQHFAIFRHLLARENPDVAMLVDVGPDRFHHGLLRHVHPEHPRYTPDDRVADYYGLLDEEVRQTVESIPGDPLVLVVSDHGVRPMKGSLCINELFIKHGLLVLDSPMPSEPVALGKLPVNWQKSRAVAYGGYCGRVMFGEHRSDSVLVKEVTALLVETAKEEGWGQPEAVFTPAALYGPTVGCPPDLTVYADGLGRRVVGSVGHPSVVIEGTDNGRDHANHDFYGIFGANRKLVAPADELGLTDVFATVMGALGLVAPTGTTGQNLLEKQG